MPTECIRERFDFHPLNHREVVARFDGGEITSDAGALLLREVEHKTGILRQLAACFTDHRNPDRVEHHVSELIAQRIYGLALGYEDVNDHDRLRHDPFFALLAGKADPSGADRRCANDRGKAIAGKSTLNRRSRSCWTWMRRTIRCTGTKKGASSTATTGNTATCRSTSSPGSSCCAPACGPPTSTPVRARWRN